MKIEDLHPDFLPTLLQMNLQQYDKYRSDFPFLKQFNLMMALGSHDLIKTLDWQHREVMKELGKDHEITKMFYQILEALSDAGSAFAFARLKNDRILKKYSHNIMSVLSDNNLILTTQSELVIKEDVGNKAEMIWQMNKEGLPVPPSFFLTFAATRLSYTANKVVPSILKQCMYYFQGKPVAIRSSGILSMPGMLDTVYVKDSSNYEEVSAAIMQVINSWYNEKAVKYRKVCKIDDLMQIGVVIQELVEATNKNGFSGSAYSRNPINGKDELCGEVLHEEMGAELASGKKTPQNLSTIPKELFDELYQHSKVLENKFKEVQYVEFAYNGVKLYMVQDRNAKLTDLARGVVSIDFFKKGWIDSTRLDRIYYDLKFKKAEGLREFVTKGTPLTKGIAASSGILTGHILLNSDTHSSNDIWFTDITTTEDLEKIDMVDGIVTTKGGYTSHPADVSRMLSKPAIVSAENVVIEHDHVIINGKRYDEGTLITINGASGEIFEGKVEISDVFILDKEFKEALNS